MQEILMTQTAECCAQEVTWDTCSLSTGHRSLSPRSPRYAAILRVMAVTDAEAWGAPCQPCITRPLQEGPALGDCPGLHQMLSPGPAAQPPARSLQPPTGLHLQLAVMVVGPV